MAHPSNIQSSSSFTVLFLNAILHVCFVVTPSYSTEHDTCNTSSWIAMSHHPDDVIVISLSSAPDTDLGDQFTKPPAEQVLQLISHLDHKPAKHTRLISAIHQRCKLQKKALNCTKMSSMQLNCSNFFFLFLLVLKMYYEHE